MWTQNIFCQWQNRHYELHWSMNPSLFLAVEKALRVHSIHSRSTWGPRASERWNYNSSLMPVLKGLPLPWVTPHEEDVILAGCYQLCKLKTWKISSSKRIIKNWGNLASSETLWQACKVFIFPATISMLENQEWGKWFLLFFFFSHLMLQCFECRNSRNMEYKCAMKELIWLPEPQPRFSAAVAQQREMGQEVSVSSILVWLFRISVLLIAVGLYTEEKRKINLLSGMRDAK